MRTTTADREILQQREPMESEANPAPSMTFCMIRYSSLCRASRQDLVWMAKTFRPNFPNSKSKMTLYTPFSTKLIVFRTPLPSTSSKCWSKIWTVSYQVCFTQSPKRWPSTPTCSSCCVDCSQLTALSQTLSSSAKWSLIESQTKKEALSKTLTSFSSGIFSDRCATWSRSVPTSDNKFVSWSLHIAPTICNWESRWSSSSKSICTATKWCTHARPTFSSRRRNSTSNGLMCSSTTPWLVCPANAPISASTHSTCWQRLFHATLIPCLKS